MKVFSFELVSDSFQVVGILWSAVHPKSCNNGVCEFRSYFASTYVLDLNRPLLFLGEPFRTKNARQEADMAGDRVFVRNALPVLLQLRLLNVRLFPIGVQLARVAVEMSCYVGRASLLPVHQSFSSATLSKLGNAYGVVGELQ